MRRSDPKLHGRLGNGDVLSPQAKSRLGAFVFGAALALASLTTKPARAYHTQDQHITDESAYTLRHKDFRFGLWKLQYGVIDQITVGTYVWPWVFTVANLHAKWRFWHNEQWAFSAFTGFYHLDTKNLKTVDQQTGDAIINVVPFELAASYRFNDRYTLTVAPVWTTVTVKGTLHDKDLKGAGEGAVNNFQLASTFEWRISRVTAFLFHGRYLVAQTAHANGDVYLHPDEFTTVEVHATTTSDAINFKKAGSLVISSVFSWETFNLRAGLSFGDYNVPGVNFVLGEGALVPDFDVYWIL